MTTVKIGDTELPTFKLSEAAIGQRVVVAEQIDSDYRWKHFVRRELAEGESLFTPKYLPVFSLRTVQGRPGKKPRWDSGEASIASQMPASTFVVDAVHINHDWTEAYGGVMIVSNLGWTGIYIDSKLVHTISPHEIAYRGDESGLTKTVVRAIAGFLGTDISMARAKVEWRVGVGVLPPDLTALKLVDIEPIGAEP